MYYHGGNFTVGSKELLSQNHVKKLLDLGFVVVSADYRLCPTISVFEGPVTDALDAYSWAQGELPRLLHTDAGVRVDGSKVVVFGHSAGGLLALLTVRWGKGARMWEVLQDHARLSRQRTTYDTAGIQRADFVVRHTGWLSQAPSSDIGLFWDEVSAGCIFPHAQRRLCKDPDV